jgi:uncharacterized protein (TIGR00251 family)
MAPNLPDYLSSAPEGALLQVRVQPRASRTAVVGPLADALKIAVKGPPVDGAANAELCKFLAKQVGISKSAVEIVRGGTGRRKAVLLHGVSPAEAAARL